MIRIDKKLLLLGSLTAILYLSLLCHAADEFNVRVASSETSEIIEREVDAAALESQKKAVRGLTGLLKRYEGTIQEPLLLSKLAEAQQQGANVLFRIAHGKARSGKGMPDLSSYRTELRNSVVTLTKLIERHSKISGLGRAYFLRARAHEELGLNKLAILDYRRLITDFAQEPEVITAYMSLAEMSAKENDHAKAIRYLEEVEKHPGDTHYPFALQRLAWSYYNLKDIRRALYYVEREVAFFGPNPKSMADEGLKENALKDSALFYLEGLEQGVERYQIKHALTYFRGLERGPRLGRVLVQFSKLLRAHGHEAELVQWKNEIIQNERRPEVLDVISIVFEDQINKRRFQGAVQSAMDLVAIQKRDSSKEVRERIEKLLLIGAREFETIISKNKEAAGIHEISLALATLYQAFEEVVGRTDPRAALAHYNLGEILFNVQEFDEATKHYRWIVDRAASAANGSPSDAALKAVSSRYEMLKRNGKIPGELKAKALVPDEQRSLPPDLEEWVWWVDQEYAKKSAVDAFYFEANRALFAQGKISTAVDRLSDFAFKNPESKYAIPSVTLVLDSLIASRRWDVSQKLMKQMNDVSQWKGTEFGRRLEDLASDVALKQAEQAYRAKDYVLALKQAEGFLKQYPQAEKIGDSLLMAGNAALALDDLPKAGTYFTQVIAKTSDQRVGAAALLSMASVSERRYALEEAAFQYKQLLKLPDDVLPFNKEEKDRYRRRAVFLAWLSGNHELLQSIARSSSICRDVIEGECEKFLVLDQLGLGRKDRSTTELAFKKSRKGSESNRGVWAALALEGAEYLGFRDRNLALKIMEGSWSRLDPLLQGALLPYLSVSIPRAFSLARKAVADVAPLIKNERYIAYRIDIIRELEATGTKLMRLPWARIRASVLNDLAWAYWDLAVGMKRLSLEPSGALEQKSRMLREKAFEVASTFGIEEESFRPIRESYFEFNEEKAKKLSVKRPELNTGLLDEQSLIALDPDGKWNQAYSENMSGRELLIARWLEALRNQKWQQVVFFLQEAKTKSVLSERDMALARAVSLIAMGAQGEGAAELVEARKLFSVSVQHRLGLLLLEHYITSYCRERTRELLEWLRDATQQENTTVAVAAKWVDG